MKLVMQAMQGQLAQQLGAKVLHKEAIIQCHNLDEQLRATPRTR